MNGLSVVVPSRTASNLIPCLRAVGENEPHLWRVVVDDSDDGTLLAGDEMDGLYEWSVRGPKPFIYARNCNLGIKAVPHDDVVLLNDDALLMTPGGFRLMQKAADEHPEYGIIGAVTNVTGQPLQRPMGIGLREVPHFAFICVLIPRRTIDKIGPLDERYCLDYGVEDRDYCWAVRNAGLTVGVFDHCYVDHGSLMSTFRGDPKTPRPFTQNWQLFQQKWGPTAL